MAPKNARLDYILVDAEVPRRCAHSIGTNGSRIAVNDALETAIALLSVLLVRTLHEAVALHTRDSASFPRTRGRNRRPCALTGSEVSLKAHS